MRGGEAEVRKWPRRARAVKFGSDTAELRGGRRGEELTLTSGSRCQPDEERDKAVGWAVAEKGNCRKGKGKKRETFRIG